MTALASVPAARIVRGIAGAAERWRDADFPPRVRATAEIAERTGYSLPVVEYGLDRLFFSIRERALEAVIGDELGGLAALDGFTARGRRPQSWARPAGRVCVVSSRTTIGVAIVPAIFALCAKCDVLVKDREDRFVRAFFATLAEELDEFAEAARAEVWSSTDVDAPELRDFDVVAAFGGTETLAEIRAAAHPEARFIGFGPRASCGYIARESLEAGAPLDELAAAAARDLVLYETEGCMSLHALFVEHGGAVAVEEFTERLARAVERAAVEFPLARRTGTQTARIANARQLAAFRAAAGQGAVYSDAGGTYVVELDPPATAPPALLPRALAVRSVDAPEEALAYLRAHGIAAEAFALSSDRADLQAMAVIGGAVRLVRFGELQHPLLEGYHGGRPRIAEFVRWVERTLETTTA